MTASDAQRKAAFDKKRPAARQRGYDSEWSKAAKAFLAEPGNDLCRCGSHAVVVMHVQSISTAPHLRMDRRNWRPGCQRCNQLDAAKERLSRKG
jgi:5-methylcytosine-specific restriction endonuclease McrA